MVILFLLPAFSLKSWAGSFELVGREGAATVVLAENPEASSVLAATELTNYVAKITGRVLPVVRGTCDAKTQVKIGTLAALNDVPAEAKKRIEGSDSHEAAWSGVKDGTLWIVGKEDTAELYATYHFLESKLGVRWFQAAIPEDPGDYYPEQEQIVLDDFADFTEPDFKRRFLCMNGAYWNVIAKPGISCAIRNGYQFSSPMIWLDEGPMNATKREFKEFFEPRVSKRFFSAGGGHTLCTAVFPPDKYFETHPEYFALRDGERRKGWQYCLSNPDLLEGIASNAIARLKRNGGWGTYCFGQADLSKGWCECENCRKLDGPGEDAYGANVNIASRVWHIANVLTPRIRAECPNATLKAFPYAVYREIPTKGKYDKSLECQFCDHGRCYGHVIDDPTCIRNVKMLKEMKAWLKELPDMYTFEYFTDTPPMYVCHERGEQRDLRCYKSLGMIGWFNEGFMTGSKWVPSSDKGIGDVFPSNWQWAYATGHLLWNVDLDLDALLADAETKYYGPAAAPMRAYHELRRNLWNSRRECMGYPNGDARRPLLLNANGAKEKLLALLDEADKLAAGDKIRQFRLSRDRQWLTEYWIKPNDKARTMAANSLRVPKATSPIKIDGDKSDAAWLGALYPNDRFVISHEQAAVRKPVPAEFATSAGITTDGESLCFLLEAKEPDLAQLKLNAKKHDDAAWGDDGFEIMIFPPSVENCYYHVAVNANGVVYDARCPGNDKAYDLGVEAKGGRTAEGWFVEVKVPTKDIYPLADGDKWRLQIVRNRYAGKAISVSFGGYLPHDTAEYLTFEFGSSCVANGAFDDVDAKGKPVGWTVYSGEVRKEGGNNVLFTRSFTSYGFRHGPLGKSSEPRKLAYSFRAKGKGKLAVSFVRYDDDKKKSGEWMPKPWGAGGTYELTDGWKSYSGTYTLNPGEWVAIAFSPSPEGCLIDDVNVVKED